jgi:hypothetical protein
VAGELLLDTGALVSLLDRSQHRHAVFTEYFETWSGEVIATETVLTEAIHLLTRVRGGPETCLDFVLSGGAVLVPASNASLRRARALIEQYRDLPMDYADATLVALAEDIGINLVFTTDQRDFSIYRIGGRQEFTLLLPA